jgi:heme oxygenase (biliverdin-producing, ferredoxin)
MCHYYNYYFAHTAGGRMIGAQVSKTALEGWMGDFYKWEGNVKELLNGAREKMNGMAAEWSREEKDVCLAETTNTFQYSGSLLRLIVGGGDGGH